MYKTSRAAVLNLQILLRISGCRWHIFLWISAIFLTPVLPDYSYASNWDIKGHVKYQFRYTQYDSDAVFAQLGEKQTNDHDTDVRVMAENRGEKWDAKIHYQAIGLYSETLDLSRRLPLSADFSPQSIISDDSRALDLTHEISNKGKRALLHRLDRLSVGYTRESLVIRIGREAISWGNGLIYNPMDLFNPFEPNAVDKDYKNGDDLLYSQWLFNNGDDIQSVLVPRRDATTENLESSKSSLAAKYHGFLSALEYDLLVARHYADNLVAAGLATDWHESVMRADLLAVQTPRHTVLSLVTNISYSWIWFEKNFSGLVEYFYNGFGQPGKEYSSHALFNNQELMERIRRGELYSLGRNYLGASATIETTPLTLVTTSLYVNLEDPSSLFQLVLNYDWKQNVTILSGLTIPIGSNGTEFGGIPTDSPGVYSKIGNMAFVQLAYFF